MHLRLLGELRNNEVIFLFFVFKFESASINNETKETQLCLPMLESLVLYSGLKHILFAAKILVVA